MVRRRARLNPDAPVPARRLLIQVAAVVLVVLFLTGLLPVEVVRVRSDSMSPTLLDGDRVVLLDTGGDASRGSVVALADPAGTGLLVKRVAAVGGDRLAIEDGVLVVNGVPVVEPYADQSRIDGMYLGPLVVPPAHVWVLGDNRGDSVDSRDFGPVPEATLAGRVTARLWPAPGAV